MSIERPIGDCLDVLLQRMCDERLSDAEKAELVCRLHEDSAARTRYLEFINLSISLADWSMPVFPCDDQSRDSHESDLNRYPNFGSRQATAHAVAEQSDAISLRRRVMRAISTSGVLAASLLVVITIGLIAGVLREPEVAVEQSAIELPSITTVDHEKFVARVVEMTPDAEWNVDAMPREFLMRLRPGEQLHLEKGLAKIEFYTGARLILHGPAKFEPTGQAAGYLHAGRLSGRVDCSEFLLVTPNAEVIDLGTEFGVSVDSMSDTDVVVFDGEVKVRSDIADARVTAESANLTEGMTVRVEKDGRLTGGSQLKREEFSRRFGELSAPNQDSSSLSLVDILCGGSGRGQRLAAAIDPLTGDWDRVGWQSSGSPGTRRGAAAFKASHAQSIIDGVFLPNSEGKLTTIDSLGRQIVLPPAHGAYTWGPVWARRFTRDLTIVPDRNENDFWGAMTFPVITARLAESKYGGIGIHASVGITFDLQEVRELHSAEIASFGAVLTNLDNAEMHNPEWAADNERSANFFVVIDGEIRYQQLNFKRNVEGVEFVVPIRPGDQMMTLISTDANNTNKYDHIVLIDPLLTLQTEPQSLQLRRSMSLLSSVRPRR